MTLSVISTYGLEMSSPCTSMRDFLRKSGNAMSSAVRNWDETSPLTRTGFARLMFPGWTIKGG
jgi:hypothetical protein